MNEHILVKYNRSNLWSRWLHAVARASGTGQKLSRSWNQLSVMIAYLKRVHKARNALAGSPPGAYAGGSLQIPIRIPVNKLEHPWDNVPMEEETASHCQIVQEIRRNQWKSAVLYFPTLGLHFTIWSPFSKHDKVMSRTRFCSHPAFSVERRGGIHWWGSKGIDHRTKVITNGNVKDPLDISQLCANK